MLRVQKGETISLNCSMTKRYEIAWYHLRSEGLILLFSGGKRKAIIYIFLIFQCICVCIYNWISEYIFKSQKYKSLDAVNCFLDLKNKL